MQDPAVQTCPHGLRPGTTVCLHCRHDARVAARQRRVRLLARAGLILLGGGAVVALVIGGIVAIAPGEDSAIAAIGQTDTFVSSAGSPAGTTPAATTAGTPPASAATSGTRPTAPVSTPAPADRAALRPSIPEGRRELGDSMFAVREGANVSVHFDTETLRTRFDWKFEGVVRATLPLVYGEMTRAALDSIPSGTLVRGGDLLTELPTRGFPNTVGDDQLRVGPITRPGRDGPLVVGYRVSAAG